MPPIFSAFQQLSGEYYGWRQSRRAFQWFLFEMVHFPLHLLNISQESEQQDCIKKLQKVSPTYDIDSSKDTYNILIHFLNQSTKSKPRRAIIKRDPVSPQVLRRSWKACTKVIALVFQPDTQCTTSFLMIWKFCMAVKVEILQFIWIEDS